MAPRALPPPPPPPSSARANFSSRDDLSADISDFGRDKSSRAEKLAGAQGPAGAGVEVLRRGKRTVVVAGDDAGSAARVLAERAGWPLLAEPTSGARVGANAIRTYRLLLGGPLADEVERVVVLGHPTLSRPVTRLISSQDVEVLAAPGPGGVVTDPGRVARHLGDLPTVDDTGPTADDTAWLEEWRAADRNLSATARPPRRRPARARRPPRRARGRRVGRPLRHPRRRLLEPRPRPRPHDHALPPHEHRSSSGTVAWPVSTGPSPPPWASPSAAATRPAPWPCSAT